MVDSDPKKRLSATEILDHPWLQFTTTEPTTQDTITSIQSMHKAKLEHEQYKEPLESDQSKANDSDPVILEGPKIGTGQGDIVYRDWKIASEQLFGENGVIGAGGLRGVLVCFGSIKEIGCFYKHALKMANGEERSVLDSGVQTFTAVVERDQFEVVDNLREMLEIDVRVCRAQAEGGADLKFLLKSGNLEDFYRLRNQIFYSTNAV